MQDNSPYPNSSEPVGRISLAGATHKASELRAGSLFAGRYEIVRLLGQGGIGSVYEARDKTLNRKVAIKVLGRPALPDQMSWLRFQQEARAAGRLKHPGIIAIHDFGVTEDEQQYLTMDYIDGLNLAELFSASGPLVLSRFLSIFLKVCDSLAYAHSEGVIHRDLKPSNILVNVGSSGEDQIWLVDFGMAKVLDKQETAEFQSLTKTGDLVGSPLYMSPEQCLGLDVGERSDIYSLGCIMYEGLLGRAPFQGENAYQTIMAHINEEPPKMKSLKTRIPDRAAASEVERIVFKTLAKEPAGRYQNVKELQSDLQALSYLSLARAEKMAMRRARITKVSTIAVITLSVLAILVWRFVASALAGVPCSPLHVWQGSESRIADIPGNYLAVVPIARDRIDVARGTHGHLAREVWQLTVRLADYQRRAAQYEEAAKTYQEANSIMLQRPLDYTMPERSVLCKLIADCYFYAHRNDKALYWYQQAVKVSLHMVDDTDTYFMEINANMGDIYYAGGQMAPALDSYERALAIRKKHDYTTEKGVDLPSAKVKTPSFDYLVLLMSAGDALYCLGNYGKANEQYERALTGWSTWLWRNGHIDQSPAYLTRDRSDEGLSGALMNGSEQSIVSQQRLGICEYDLAITCEQLGENSRARKLFEASLNDIESSSSPENPYSPTVIKGYGQFLKRHDFLVGFLKAQALERRSKKGSD
jgi:tRNA A-37 threonylcarbamoyl transferase component Bud32/tetratricopeptide (TPR) repeat protein